MHEQPTVTAVETRVIFALEIVIFLIGTGLIVAGIILAGSTASMVGRVPGYGLGLTLVTLGFTTVVGGGAMHFHRRRMEDRDKEVAVIRTDIAVIRKENATEIATIRESIKSLGAQVQALTRIEEKKFDQLAGRRNSNGG
jgi:hypothetical protein